MGAYASGMTQHQTPRFASPDGDTLPLWLATPETLSDIRALLPERDSAWVKNTGFSAGAGTVVVLPGEDGTVAGAIGGLGSDADAARRRFTAATIAARLPDGAWRIATDHSPQLLEECALAWLLSEYRFDRYKSAKVAGAHLLASIAQQKV